MQEAVVVAVEFDPGVEQVADVGVGNQVGERRVAARGDHHLYPHPAARCQPERVEQHGRGQEIGRGDAYGAVRPDDGRGKGVGDGQPRGPLLGPGQLDRQPLPDAVRGDVAAAVEVFAAYTRPVGDEEPLQVGHGVALHAQVFVAPFAHVIPVEVVFGDVYAAQVGDLAVGDHYLAVVAVRDARGEPREANWFESRSLDPRVVHAAQCLAAQAPRADGIVDHPHLEPRAGFADQYFGDGVPDAVVADDVVLHVDRARGPLQRGDQCREGVVAVVEQPDAVVPGGACAASVGDDLFEAVAAAGGAIRRGAVAAVAGQYVEQRAGDGQQQDQRQPGCRRGGDALLARDDGDGHERPG